MFTGTPGRSRSGQLWAEFGLRKYPAAHRFKSNNFNKPYIVALMTASLELSPLKKVLEIGTGSGYQTAILAELAGKVVNYGTYPGITCKKAKTVLDRLGTKNIEIHSRRRNLWAAGRSTLYAIIATARRPEQSLIVCSNN